MWIIAKITPQCCKLARPGLLCPAIAKNQGGPGQISRLRYRNFRGAWPPSISQGLSPPVFHRGLAPKYLQGLKPLFSAAPGHLAPDTDIGKWLYLVNLKACCDYWPATADKMHPKTKHSVQARLYDEVLSIFLLKVLVLRGLMRMQQCLT